MIGHHFNGRKITYDNRMFKYSETTLKDVSITGFVFALAIFAASALSPGLSRNRLFRQ